MKHFEYKKMDYLDEEFAFVFSSVPEIKSFVNRNKDLLAKIFKIVLFFRNLVKN